VFTARYALSPYIKQIRFVFKGLIIVLNIKTGGAHNNKMPGTNLTFRDVLVIKTTEMSQTEQNQQCIHPAITMCAFRAEARHVQRQEVLMKTENWVTPPAVQLTV
jgi:hypothetical protein